MQKVKDKEKDYTKDEIGQLTDFMREEINLVRPTYVLTCGSRATSLFNNKSKPSDRWTQRVSARAGCDRFLRI